MVQINFGKKTIKCRLVYYGPAGAGKTASLKLVERKAPARGEGQLTQVNSETERTLFFEYMPMKLGKFDGLETTMHVYTVPPRESAVSTRLTIMRGLDAVIFVADSRRHRMGANLSSLEQLFDDLRELGLNPTAVPIVMQWGHQDDPEAMSPHELDAALNPGGCASFAASAVSGVGVLAALKKASLVTLETVGDRFGLSKTQKIRRPTPKPEEPQARTRSESSRLRAVRAQVDRVTRRSTRNLEVLGVAPATKKRTRLFNR